EIYDVTLPWLQIQGAEAAFETGQAPLADSLLDRVDLVCRPCDFFYRYEPSATRLRPTRLPPASGGRRIRSMPARRLYVTVALCAVVVYLGALWNQFA